MKDTRIVPDSSQYQLWRDDKHVATVYNHDDARLFNAASDLLSACEALARSFDAVTYAAWTPEMHAAVASIAKAKGETK